MYSKPNDSTSFEEFIKSIKSAPNLKTLTTRIRNKFTDVFQVEMATIFMVDAANKLLVSWILMPGESLRKICIPITKSSISGYVAACGKKLMIPDVYNQEELIKIEHQRTNTEILSPVEEEGSSRSSRQETPNISSQKKDKKNKKR